MARLSCLPDRKRLARSLRGTGLGTCSSSSTIWSSPTVAASRLTLSPPTPAWCRCEAKSLGRTKAAMSRFGPSRASEPVAAMALGQSNSNGAFSEADMIRMQTASNIGRAGDEEVMRLNMTEHPIVTLPAGLRVYVVFEKASRSRSPNGLPGQVLQGLEAPPASPTGAIRDKNPPDAFPLARPARAFLGKAVLLDRSRSRGILDFHFAFGQKPSLFSMANLSENPARVRNFRSAQETTSRLQSELEDNGHGFREFGVGQNPSFVSGPNLSENREPSFSD